MPTACVETARSPLPCERRRISALPVHVMHRSQSRGGGSLLRISHRSTSHGHVIEGHATHNSKVTARSREPLNCKTNRSTHRDRDSGRRGTLATLTCRTTPRVDPYSDGRAFREVIFAFKSTLVLQLKEYCNVESTTDCTFLICSSSTGMLHSCKGREAVCVHQDLFPRMRIYSLFPGRCRRFQTASSPPLIYLPLLLLPSPASRSLPRVQAR